MIGFASLTGRLHTVALAEPPALPNGIKCNRKNGCDKEQHHENRKHKGSVVEMRTRHQRVLLCLNYMFVFGIHSLGELGYEMARFTCLVRLLSSLNIRGNISRTESLSQIRST